MQLQMASPQELFLQYEGKLVPHDYEAGLVVVSVIICFVGTSSALELIRRQTSNKGLHNLLLLAGAAICMGGIAMWSMHYIGNRSVRFLDGQREFQFVYKTGLAVVALLIPIIVLFVAFIIITRHGRVCWVRITLAGFISGATLVGMHYLVDASIDNYKPVYHVGNIVGAALIGVFTNIGALAFLFVFESAWTDRWWKRPICAFILAVCISAENWCAAAGTEYRLRGPHHHGALLSTKGSIIVVICLTVGGFVFTVLSAVYSYWIQKDYANKAQKVALAAAVFDDRGRIMVSHEGLLPSEVITDTFIPTSNNDVFDTSNPVFHWMFWASRNWPRIAHVLPGMEAHVASLSSKTNRKLKLKLLGEDGEAVENYNMILCELYCLAASSLSLRMKEDIESTGMLWDEIFATGDVSGSFSRSSSSYSGGSELPMYRSSTSSIIKPETNEKHDDRGNDGHGKGSLMFIVRHVSSRRDVERLEVAGFRFAEIHRVLGSIRTGMQIKTPDFAARLRIMSTFNEQDSDLRPGVHVGLFALRARVDLGGFDVLVQRKAKNLLPTVHLQKESLRQWQKDIIERINGMTTPEIIENLNVDQFESARERHFARQLLEAITSLRSWTDQPIFDEARLNTSVVQVPCSSIDQSATCSVLTFQLMLPIHLTISFRNYEAIPLQFFKVRQFFSQGFNGPGRTSTGVMAQNGLHFPNSSNSSLGGDSGPTTFMEFVKPGRPFRKNVPHRPSHHTLAQSFKRLSFGASGRNARPGSAADDATGDTQPFAAAMAPPGQADLHHGHSILVSQEVVVNYQQSFDPEDDEMDITEKGTRETGSPSEQSRQYRPGLSPPPEAESYSVTATGTDISRTKDEASFVDELLQSCMEQYKPMKKQ
ncbi:MHYT domain signaling protein [Ophiocordyceps camponoti-floridani]|uniref:MHYT domain signaling protein n=1 Tax=Ophiocordyceps camponoti-floridani TaxID=2030778 RepID=A0A8H4Q391_9HYPO|nr:MHYT domain signaling protein [Ophiocordyceps camponoti-floridani]